MKEFDSSSNVVSFLYTDAYIDQYNGTIRKIFLVGQKIIFITESTMNFTVYAIDLDGDFISDISGSRFSELQNAVEYIFENFRTAKEHFNDLKNDYGKCYFLVSIDGNVLMRGVDACQSCRFNNATVSIYTNNLGIKELCKTCSESLVTCGPNSDRPLIQYIKEYK